MNKLTLYKATIETGSLASDGYPDTKQYSIVAENFGEAKSIADELPGTLVHLEKLHEVIVA